MPMAVIQRQQETLNGTINRVVFRSLETGFSVLQVRTPTRGMITIVGVTSGADEGDKIEARGIWHNDRRFGLQFKADLIVPEIPDDQEGLVRYIASGKVSGIGQKTAERLVEAFGNDIFRVAEAQPEALAEIKGMTPERARDLAKFLQEERGRRDTLVQLYSLGIGPSLAGKILGHYGHDCMAVLRHNPYQLINDIHGVGFKTADGIAQRMGLSPDNPFRIAAGLQHALAESEKEGHCALPTGNLIDATSTLLAQPRALVQQKLMQELSFGNLIEDVWPDEALIYSARMHRAEKMLASRLKDLAAGKRPWGDLDSDAEIEAAEKELSIKLSPTQRQAIETALRSKVTVITGGPGRGKTTILKVLLQILSKRVSMTLCAPTGRAAKRLEESTGRMAGTIHRTLEYDPVRGRFNRNASNPLTSELVVLDEASMVDVKLGFFLLSAIDPKAAFVIVGDADQLPSIGPGNVLNDIIRSGTLPVVTLTEIFRQARESRIVTAADEINKGLVPALSNDFSSDLRFVEIDDAEQAAEHIVHLATQVLPEQGFDPMNDVQVMSPMRRGPLGTNALNILLQERLNPIEDKPSIKRFEWHIAPGDKLMQIKNNYEKGIFNGDIGFVEEVNPAKRSLILKVDDKLIPYEAEDLDELVLAYAATIHKMQGSECPVVIMPVSMSHFIMLQRNLIYTGLTRGKRLVYMVGQKRALAIAVARSDSKHRYTRLCDRLKG